MKSKNKKYAIICSGGCAPGMGTCVIVFIKKCLSAGVTPVAFYNGFEGLHNNDYVELKSFLQQHDWNDGSALIGSGRCPQFATDAKYRKQCAANLKKHNIDGLIVVGGEGSYRGALEMSKLGAKVVAVPATIDNDVASTSYTVGFDTCLNTICDAVSKINDCFVSHRGIALVELMGKTCPDLTIRSAIANNATYMVTPYSKLSPKDFLKIANQYRKKGYPHSTFLIIEKLYPKEGPNSLDNIAKWIEKESGSFTRHVEVGYIQRGGNPSARDRLLANYMINLAVNQLLSGKHSKAICRRSRKTIVCDLAKAVSMKRKSWNRELVTIFNKINLE